MVDCAGRCTRSGVDTTKLSPNVHIIPPLEDCLTEHRVIRALIPFSDMNTIPRENLFDKAANYYIKTKGGETFAYLIAAEQVARQLGLAIETLRIAMYSPLLLLTVFLLLLPMLMLIMIALTLMCVLDAFEVVAYCVIGYNNADAKLANVACHLVGACDR